jgi:hypothetical protein
VDAATAGTKHLIRTVARRALDGDLLADTADRIAEVRASDARGDETTGKASSAKAQRKAK